MKHFIFTRFYSINFFLNERIFSDEVLDAGLIHMKEFLIPSLENQTNKNFTLVIDIHDELETKNKRIYNELQKLKMNIDFAIVKHKDLISYVDSFNEDFIIGTRIDCDDCIFNEAVDLTQKQFDSNLDFKFFAFMNGTTQCTNDMYNLYEFISPLYDGWSSFSAFPSIIVNWKKYRIIPYYCHTKLKEFCEKNKVELNSLNCIHDYDTKCAWIWNQHGMNTSYNADGITQKHRSNVKVNMSREEIKQRFGI